MSIAAMIGSGGFGKWAQALAGADDASTTATTGQGSATATTTAGTSSTEETGGTSTTGDRTSTSTSTGHRGVRWRDRDDGRHEHDDPPVPFVVNSLVRDDNALREALGGGDVEAIWRGAGLCDEGGAGRPALDTWLEALARPHE